MTTIVEALPTVQGASEGRDPAVGWYSIGLPDDLQRLEDSAAVADHDGHQTARVRTAGDRRGTNPIVALRLPAAPTN